MVSLEQCEQLVAELQGSVRQAVQLYHLVRVGHPHTSGVLAQCPESNAKALPLVGVEQLRTSWAEEAKGLEARSGHLNQAPTGYFRLRASDLLRSEGGVESPRVLVCLGPSQFMPLVPV